jgi:hypothetical protein
MNKHLYIGEGLNSTDFTINLRNGFCIDEAEEFFKASENIWNPIDDGTDKLYFLPGCTVPRFKVKEHYSSTLKPETATAVFVPEDYTFPVDENKKFQTTKTIEIKVTDMLGYIKANYGKDCKSWNKIHMLSHMNSFSLCYVEQSFFLANYYRAPHDATTGSGQAFDQFVSGSRWAYQSGTEESCKTMCFIPLDSALNSITCNVYFEKDLLKHLNKDSLVIDEKKYNELVMIGESEDDENIVLMMELMANSNFEKSYVYLLMLLKAYGDKMAYQKVINHVNFRSLLTYFDIERKQLGHIDLLKLTNALKHAKKFTRSNIQIIQSLCASDYIRYDDKTVSKYFIEGPCLRPEFSEFNYVGDD